MLSVVEITDEQDALVGYAVLSDDADDGFRLLPTVYSTRSQAHAAIEGGVA